MNAAEVAHALGGAVRCGPGRYRARCPAHGDRTPSLSLKDTEDGRLLAYCHGGCSQAAVIDELKRLGLWPEHEHDRSVQRRQFVQRDDDTAERRRAALYLWRHRHPIEGTLAETYLREHRLITCALPATLGFLPGNDRYPPAMIAAFGIADETEPEVLAIGDHAVMGVHLTKLADDGRKHLDEPNKVIIGRCPGSPVVLAPMNDLLGLAICEGIEDALSVHTATGLGAWAAGSANRMPALADAMPDYTDCVTIFMDADAAGEGNATELAERLGARGIHAEAVPSSGALA